MTTTTTMKGMNPDDKPTSRVLRPPGGGSSDIFGTGSVAHQTPPQTKQNRSSSNIFGGDEAAQGTVDKSSPAYNAVGDHKIYGKGRNQSSFNPITGEAYGENGSPSAAKAEQEQPQKQPSPRQQQETTAPPVGASPQTEGQGDFQAMPGKAQPAVHTSSRVLNPPGGKTTKLW